MAEADHDFLGLDAAADVGLGLVRVVVALLDLEGDLVGAAVLRAAQRADAAGDAEYMSLPVPAITRPVKVEALNSCSAYRLSECASRAPQRRSDASCRAAGAGSAADRVVVGLDLDALAVVRSGTSTAASSRARPSAVGDVARAGRVVVVLLGQHAAEHRDAGAHHVHRMRGGRQLLQRGLDGGGQAAQRLQLGLVGAQFGRVGSLPCTSRWRSPRTRRPRRCRGCRSRGNAGRCRCGRPCTAPCCRRSRRTGRRISSA
jgi:hypothetical protein